MSGEEFYFVEKGGDRTWKNKEGVFVAKNGGEHDDSDFMTLVQVEKSDPLGEFGGGWGIEKSRVRKATKDEVLAAIGDAEISAKARAIIDSLS